MKIIKDIEELKTLAGNPQSPLECYISLNHGIRSSKSIAYDEQTKMFSIMNEVDGSEDILSADMLFDEGVTNVGQAMNEGALVAY